MKYASTFNIEAKSRKSLRPILLPGVNFYSCSEPVRDGRKVKKRLRSWVWMAMLIGVNIGALLYSFHYYGY
jgi:hypothetical protein